MKKGCIIAIVAVLVIGGLAIGGLAYFGYKKGIPLVNSTAALAFEQAIAGYRDKNPDAQVELSNKAWVTALGGAINFQGEDMSKLLNGGEMRDALGTPLALKQDTNGNILAVSAGFDKQHGTEDDVTSQKMRDMMKEK